MCKNYAIVNKTANLIPVINPEIQEDNGIKTALKYRITKCIEIDSSELVKAAYREWYGDDIPGCADTIFNIFIPFREFCISRLKSLPGCYPFEKVKGSWKIKEDLNNLIYDNLNCIFDGNEELEQLFNATFDLMYSFSNFMPVPLGFNGNERHNGKGTYRLNKDYPFLYLENLRDKSTTIYNKNSNLEYLSKNMAKFNIEAMYNLEPPYNINEYYDDGKKEGLIEWLKKVKYLIENRFTNPDLSCRCAHMTS